MTTERWLRAWDSQGPHRTATLGDHTGADWLAAEARALGAAVTREAFALWRVDPGDTFLEVNGVRHPGVPVFDSPATAGIDGVLGTDIAVATLGPHAVYTGEYHRLRREGAHAGLVIQTKDLALLNAEHFSAPYGAPAIHIDAAVPIGCPGRLVSDSTRTHTEAHNVVVALGGTDRTRPPVVVMTPRSSWWESTSERGGGVVCWLETLKALIAEPPTCDVILTANSGHELGHLGLDAFQVRRPGWDQPGGAIWVHYGANIGAAGGTLSIVSPDDALRAGMRSAVPVAMAPKDLVPSGETRDIHRAGGRYVTLVGTNPLFHVPHDRFPHSVDIPAIARFAAGAARFVVALTR